MLVSALTLIFCIMIPAIVFPRRTVQRIVKFYLGALFFLLRGVLGVSWHAIGNVSAASNPVLVAAKHQSAFETLILQYLLEDPAIVLKKELLAIPIVGWVLRRLGHIGIDREGGLEAARKLRDAALAAHMEGRPVVIFPEGSRRAIDAPTEYKSGVDLLYALLKCPCIPVAVNSGRLLEAKSLTPSPGRITIEFLEIIESGLPRAAFVRRLHGSIESGTEELVRNSV